MESLVAFTWIPLTGPFPRHLWKCTKLLLLLMIRTDQQLVKLGHIWGGLGYLAVMGAHHCGAKCC